MESMVEMAVMETVSHETAAAISAAADHSRVTEATTDCG
jgi:hypothetical protein